MLRISVLSRSAGLGLSLASLLSLLTALPLAAEPSKVAISLRLAQAEDRGGPVTLRILGDQEDSSVQATAPWQGEVLFKPPARLQVEAEGYWAREVALVDGATSPVDVVLWPAGEVRGRFTAASPLPAVLEISFQPVRLESREKPKTEPSGKTACRLEADRIFACRVPAAAIDFKLEAAGFVPHYFWNQTAAPGAALELRPLLLEKGASVAGWVALPPGIAKPVEVALEVAATGFEGDPVLGTRLARKRRAAPVDERGFFQLPGIEPGAWSLAARAPGRPDGPAVPLVVLRDRELVVPEVLELPDPGRLRVFLEPGSRQWTFSLLALSRGSRVETEVRQATPDASGWLELVDLPTGHFLYRVADAEGGIWTSGEVAIAGGDNPPLLVEIAQIPISGKVLIGAQPVAAKLDFGAMGEQQIPVLSDEEGRFAATLPRGGRWELAAELPQAGYVRLPAVTVPREGGELTLRIPGASVAGRVYEDGRPKADVLVLVQDNVEAAKRILGTGLTDAEGRFRTSGLGGGKVRVWAKSADRQSEWTELELEDGEALSDLRLDLLASQKIRGQVRTQGFPLPGAKVVAIPNPGHLGQAAAVSGIDGRFEILLPAGSAGAILIGLAQGYAAAIESLPQRVAHRDIQLSEGAGELVLRGLFCEPGTHTLSYGAARLDLFDAWLTFLAVGLAADGPDTLTLKGLPPGPYSLCDGASGKCFEISITAGLVSTLDLPPPERALASP